MRIDICLSPALYPYYRQENDTVVVVDIFRATTTMCMMLKNGASAVIPVATVEEAQSYKKEGFLVGGERNARKIDFADFGNSPFDYSRQIVKDKEVVFTTTNGTQAINAAKESAKLFIGAFSNIETLAEQCLKAGNRVVALCSGWKNKINIEDTLFAGALAERLSEKAEITFDSDSVSMALRLWKSAEADPIEFVRSSDHYKRLVDNGAETDIPYCFEMNTAPVVPTYDKEVGKLKAD